MCFSEVRTLFGRSPVMLTLDFLAVAYFLVTLFLYLKRRRERLPLPPSPKKIPLVGNLFDMPQKLQWEIYHQWSKDLGWSRNVNTKAVTENLTMEMK